MEKLLTIFTPTFNRADCLSRLYDSLCRQSESDFEWLIVDDGSTDNTNSLVSTWILDNKISIRYFYQKNAGKSMAHNNGVQKTNTELFFCVDSDDTLVEDAVKVISQVWKQHNKNNTGLLLKKFDLTLKKSVTFIPKDVHESTLYDAYNSHGLKGDTALVFKTSVINKYEFPHFEGEKFVPESYLYDLIDTNGPLIIVDKSIYNCEYLNDGYTSNMMKLLCNNPKGYTAYISQRLSLHDKTFISRYLDSARYVAMMLTFNSKKILVDSVYPFYTILAFPLGYVLFLRKYKNL